MASERCIHGLDARFCANCNRVKARANSSRGPAPHDIGLPEVLRFLNDQRLRATYAAVAEVVHVPVGAIGGHLGERRPEASWVVSSDSGLPTGYSESECHSELFANPDVIRTANDLTLRLAVWRRQQS